MGERGHSYCWIKSEMNTLAVKKIINKCIIMFLFSTVVSLVLNTWIIILGFTKMIYMLVSGELKS